MNKETHQQVAEILNQELGVADFEVIDTTGLSGYCSSISIRVSDDSWDLYWQAKTIDRIDDILASRLGVYIEPYNKRLLNIAKL